MDHADGELTIRLSEFIADMTFEQLPEHIVTLAKTHLLDALAAGFLGATLPWPKIVAELVANQGGFAQASVFGRSEQVTASQAALLNGAMISAFEVEYSGEISHTAATVTPPALAQGEFLGVDGKALLLALVLGSEVGCRLGGAQTKSVEEERGFHNPAVNGPLASAAATGSLLQLDAQTQARAFGIAGSHAGGLAEFAWDGSMTKRLHLGRAAQSGLESAQLAGLGFTGPITVIEGKYGWLQAFSPTPKPDKLLAGLGSEWRIEEVITKIYPAKGHSQGIVSALTELKSQRDVDHRVISDICIKTTDPRKIGQERYFNRRPTTLLGAQYSVPFMTALGVVRNLDDPLQFDESVLDDADVLRLAEVVRWEPMRGASGHLEIDLVAGDQTHTARTGPYRGSIENPATRAEIEDKFVRYSRHILSPEQQAAVVQMVDGLDNLDDVRPLVGLIRGAD